MDSYRNEGDDIDEDGIDGDDVGMAGLTEAGSLPKAQAMRTIPVTAVTPWMNRRGQQYSLWSLPASYPKPRAAEKAAAVPPMRQRAVDQDIFFTRKKKTNEK